MASATANNSSKITFERAKSHLGVHQIDTTNDWFIEDVLLPGLKNKADRFVNRSFDVYPPEIDIWILSMLYRYFEQRANGVAKETDAAGSVDWGFLDYDMIMDLRKNPGL